VEYLSNRNKDATYISVIGCVKPGIVGCVKPGIVNIGALLKYFTNVS
jgi:hypothetical protein